MKCWGLALLVLTGSASACGDSVPAFRRHLVEMRGMSFVPAEVAVQAGDTVVWVNHDIVPHTATADDGSWTTAHLARGDSVWRVIAEGESGRYHCELHPAMQATLRAER